MPPKAEGIRKMIKRLICRLIGHKYHETEYRDAPVRHVDYVAYNCKRCGYSEIYARPGGRV